MKKSLLALLLTSAVIAGAFALLNLNKSKRVAKIAERQNITMEVPVKLFSVEQQNLDRRIRINGVLSARRQVTILAETAGQVQRIYREVGETVWQGSPLALVDATIVSTQLETARASLENSKRDLARFQNLAQSGAATQQTVDNLRLAVEAANTNVIALQKQLTNTTVKSPQRGVVVRRMVEVGSVVGGGAPTFMVADLSEMIMKVGLTEMEIVHVKQGMPATVRIDALSRDFDAVIHTIGIAADMSGRYSIDVLITDPAAKGELRPDLSGNVSFDLPTLENALVIPREALVDGVKDPKVYVVENGKATMRRIVLGEVEGTNAIVQGGLSLGEHIVLTGHQNLYEDAAVRILQ
ncbi:MAG: efflux RND transporter periplasmic adaptor subunit [Fibromonadaceae bacterium]|jgi:RND family efflux transporter MFP subunit|nr:efflux RND transporter periplasmic adaptor subunit [Fibromonadaceae bacterium]